MSRSKQAEPRLIAYFGVWLALMVLLSLTIASSFVPIGHWNLAINLLIAVLKALLVAVFFMRLRDSSPLIRLAAVVGIVWLCILVGLSLTDVLTRGG
jgi:cytochrome c oxidase subunit 4